MAADYQHVVVPPFKPQSGQPIPCRYEINEFLRHGDRASLCLHAYQHFQNEVLKEDVSSWFEIAGIYGCPFRERDRVPRYAQGYQGYCPHGGLLFLPWHRAWIALFERTPRQSAEEVVAEFERSDRKTDRDFGERLRVHLPTFSVPYWNWAVKSPSQSDAVPDIFREKRVTITAPDSTP